MKWTPAKKTEKSAIARHTDWVIISRQDDRCLIRCKCCHPADKTSDLRWIFKSQIVE